MNGNGSNKAKRKHWTLSALSVGAVTFIMPFMAACSGPITTTAPPTATTTTSATPTVTSTSTATASPTPSATAALTGDALWVDYVRQHTVSATVMGETDEELISSAKKTCDQLRDGELFEEAAYKLVSAGLPKTYQDDMSVILGTGTAKFCFEFVPNSGTGDNVVLERLRAVAPIIAGNPDDAILSQARSACPAVAKGLAGGAATVQEARRAWGHDQGYKFIVIAVFNYCPTYLNNVIENK